MSDKFSQASARFNTLQTELSQLVAARQQLEAQLQENKIVQTEFDGLGVDAKIYKKVGPVLLPQDTEESKANVAKRLEFIGDEIKRVEDKIATAQKSVEQTRNELLALQAEQKSEQAAAV